MEEENAYELLKQGVELLEEGHPVQAASVLERASSMEPEKGSILEALGRAYYSCGRFRDAETRFAEAVLVDPNNDYAHYCLGLCLLKARRTAEAGAHFKLAWSMRPAEVYREQAARFGAAGAAGERPAAGAR